MRRSVIVKWNFTVFHIFLWGCTMYEIFEKLVKERGLKVSDVCRATGISPSTLSDWKAGRSTPKMKNMAKLTEYFGVSMEYLMTGKKQDEYYLNPETAKIAQQVFDDPDLRLLFDAARDVKPENIRLAAEMLRRFKETS